MRVEPIGDKIIVKRLEVDETSAGGIVLPESAREKPQQGRVLSVGAGRMNDDGSRADLQVQEGDRVLFSTYSGTEVKVDEDDLLIMTEDEILAILE